MLYPLVIIFMCLYYVRPQEWIPIVSMTHPVAITLSLGILALIGKALPFRPKELLKTPHDWFMMAFFAYTIYYAPDSGDAFSDLKNRIVMYLIVVHGLTSIKRLTAFCWWWCGLITFVAFLAWLSHMGIDPTNAAGRTRIMDGRLLVGLSIFYNPNALGHGVIPLLPMIYQLAFWRRPIPSKQIGIAILAIPIHVLVLTQSKGAYLAGAASLAAGLILGRNKWVQLSLIVLAITLGASALQALPRMGVLSGGVHGLKHRDEGIYGRWLAMKWGLDQFTYQKHGVGYHKWEEAMEASDLRVNKNKERFVKPAHCAYAEVGGELGKQGLYIWLGCLYCCLRTLIGCKCRTVEEERIRRLLFAAIVAYMASSWFTDIPYQGTFFFSIGATAAFHRILRQRDELEAPESELESEQEELAEDIVTETSINEETPTFIKREAEQLNSTPSYPDGARTSETNISVPQEASLTSSLSDSMIETPKEWIRQSWKRLGVLDFALIYALYWGVTECWIWLVENL